MARKGHGGGLPMRNDGSLTLVDADPEGPRTEVEVRWHRRTNIPNSGSFARNTRGESDPLSVLLPGLGEALAVFSFGEEALLYAHLSGGGGDR
jgi:hypothetical protein